MRNLEFGIRNARPMKDSGVEWIGEIPEEWEIIRIKNLADDSQINSFIDGDWIESPDISDEGIRYLTTGNVGDGFFKRQGNGFITEETFVRLNCKYAYPGDYIIARLNAPYGRSCLLPDDYEKYVLAVDIVILRTKTDKRFLCYLTQCDGYQKSVEDEAKGTTMKRISRTNLGRIPLPIPPLNEQRRIADFLDWRCAEIDRVIAATEQTIAEYKALKQSIITEAVTKGVRGPRPMKDSGVEWIGEIPSVWSISKIKNGVTKVGSGKTPSGGAESYADDGILFLRSQNIYDSGLNLENSTYITVETDAEMKNTRVEPHDVLLNITGGSIGRCCIFPASLERANVNQHVSIIRVINSVFLPGFMHYYWLSSLGYMAIHLYQTGGNREGMTADAIKNSPIPLPSIDEEKEIVAFLDTKCSEIDQLIEAKQQLLTELENYKKSVIYEYVTGKKEVG